MSHSYNRFTHSFEDGKWVRILDNDTGNVMLLPLQYLNQVVKQAKALQKTRTV